MSGISCHFNELNFPWESSGSCSDWVNGIKLAHQNICRERRVRKAQKFTKQELHCFVLNNRLSRCLKENTKSCLQREQRLVLIQWLSYPASSRNTTKGILKALQLLFLLHWSLHLAGGKHLSIFAAKFWITLMLEAVASLTNMQHGGFCQHHVYKYLLWDVPSSDVLWCLKFGPLR